jgi:hypothetical protein
MNPIPKKDYSKGINVSFPSLDPFEVFYNRYLKFKNCKKYHKINNNTSVFDYLLTSGTSAGDLDIIVEHKRRWFNRDRYAASFIEKLKYDNLIDAGKLLNAPVLYVVEYDDSIAYWRLDTKKIYRADCLPSPVSQTDSTIDLKDCLHLTFEDAIIVYKPFYKLTNIYE